MRSDLFSAAFAALSPREREVLELIAKEGLENDEVAQRLEIAVSTVETHRARGLRSLAQYARSEPIGLRRFTSLWWKHVGS